MGVHEYIRFSPQWLQLSKTLKNKVYCIFPYLLAVWTIELTASSAVYSVYCFYIFVPSCLCARLFCFYDPVFWDSLILNSAIQIQITFAWVELLVSEISATLLCFSSWWLCSKESCASLYSHLFLLHRGLSGQTAKRTFAGLCRESYRLPGSCCRSPRQR